MTEQDLLEYCEDSIAHQNYIQLPEDLFNALTPEMVSLLVKKYGNTNMLMLPEKDLRFFEWVKNNDPEVWNDLWAGDDLQPYLVSTTLLPAIRTKARGFPICDLLETHNYYFSEAHISDKESEILLESVKKRFMDNKTLTTPQLLLLEISLAPIDIWRFAFNHKIEIDEAKAAVHALVEDEVLVHLKDAEHLAHFLDL